MAMKDITIKITGKQCYDDVEEDQMEFITDGRLFERNGFCYLVYDVTEDLVLIPYEAQKEQQEE